MEWRGREWSGGDGREGEGRARQGRVPDCLGGLSRVGISSRSTRPWNGQPPSFNCFSPIYSFDLVLLSSLCCFERSSSCFGCHGGIVNDNYCNHGASGKIIGRFLGFF